MNYLAIDIGGTFIKYAVITESAEIISKGKKPTDTENLDVFLDTLEEIYRENEESNPAGVAISMAGVLDVDSGYAYNGGGVRCIQNLEIVNILEERLKVPVTIENDAKAAALAEVWKGNLSDVRDGIVIVIGTAIGGAVIIDRKVLRGKNLMAGEFSYISIGEPGKPAWTDIWGNTGGARGLIQMTAAKKGLDPESLDGVAVFEMVNGGDAEARAALREYTDLLAQQIMNLQVVINPERFVVGGGISCQPVLFEELSKSVQVISDTFFGNVPVPDIMPCRFFNDSNLIGALYAHLTRRGIS
jgi:predicted NBD/HSP70 family sugar kinase